MARTNAVIRKAAIKKNDEFYTRYEDIEAEVIKYKEQFKNKIVLCNCDDPEWSNFWKFFHDNFISFQLKELISTHYVEEGSSYAMIYDGIEDKKIPLAKNETTDPGDNVNLFEICDIESNGDFRSRECLEYLKKADIVVTNPPFSLFREFVTKIVEYDKKFLVIGNMNEVCCREIFPLFKENKIWIGYGFNRSFVFKAPYPNTSSENRRFVISKGLDPDDGYVKVHSIAWFTNLDTDKRHKDFVLCKNYNEKDYPMYDNFNAININKLEDIPCDYYGIMGVPVTFVDKYNPEQFELVGLGQGDDFINIGGQGVSEKFIEDYYKFGGKGDISAGWRHSVYYEDGKPVVPYWRIFIKRKSHS